MKALVSALVVIVTGTVLAGSTQAQCLEKFVNDCARDFKRTNAWPEPFIRNDRAAVRMPFDLMTQRGWQEQNLLSGYHFKEDGVQLNEAGQHKLHWILTEAPRHRRTVFVQQGATAELTSARMASVQQLAAQVNQNPEQPPMIVASTLAPPTWSAERAETIGRKFHASMPEPKLPERKDEQN